MNSAIYIRKSREEKDKPSHRLTVQREQLPAYATAQGWQVEIYDDGHASAARGKTDDLRERGRLERDIRAGRVQIVLCIELSRLSRDDSLQDYVGWLHLCSQHRVKLATLTRTLDPAQHSDWMLLIMEGGFSSVEMRVLQARMAEGRAQAHTAGKWLGGAPPAPYRYDKAQGRPVIDPDLLPQMQTLWSLAETHSAKAIAEQLRLPEINVRRAISDDRLLLCQAQRKHAETGEIIPCDWEPCLTAEQADRIRRARRTRRTNGAARPSGGLLSNLSGLLRCGYCGRTAKTWQNSRTRNDGNRLDYYGCVSKNNGDTCTKSRMVPQPVLDERVLTNLFGTLDRLDQIKALWTTAHDNTDQITALTRQATELTTKKGRLIDAITDGIIPLADARGKLDQLNREAADTEQQIHKLSAAQTAPDWQAYTLSRDEFALLDLDHQREFLRLVLIEIRIFGTYAIITYPFPRDATGTPEARIHLPPPQRGCTAGRAPVYRL